ncbi:MAG: hypothetical protein KGI06_02610 [Candidatus Micrarchaeota archaeon]|nr:hypothetical protein [Candidatus Micrarchaeota archaeon]
MAGKLSIRNDNLVFEVEGIDEIFAIKRIIKIPLKHVTSVSSSSIGWFKPIPYVKVGGTSIPGMVRDGRFVTSRGWVFYVMHNPEKCISIRLNHEMYRTAIFEVPDKRAAISMIEKAIRARKKRRK